MKKQIQKNSKWISKAGDKNQVEVIDYITRFCPGTNTKKQDPIFKDVVTGKIFTVEFCDIEDFYFFYEGEG